MSMNISPHIPQVVVNSATPSTESLVKTNAAREVIPPTVKTEANVPQKSREQEARAQNANVTYENIQSYTDSEIISESEDEASSEEQSSQQNEKNQAEQNDSEAQTNGQDDDNPSANDSSSNPNQLTEAEIEVVEELKLRDKEVKAHEQAHAAIGGALASSPRYEYQTGPDGQKYAVGGEVSIDVSKEDDPEETIRKMQTVQAAALAPAEPSSQDRKVAAEASRNISEARAELITESSSVTNEEKSDAQLATEKSRVAHGSKEILQADDGVSSEDNDNESEQISNTSHSNNKTAQVVFQRYAESSLIKEHQFNAVA